jgi:hypothetical protein
VTELHLVLVAEVAAAEDDQAEADGLDRLHERGEYRSCVEDPEVEEVGGW